MRVESIIGNGDMVINGSGDRTTPLNHIHIYMVRIIRTA